MSTYVHTEEVAPRLAYHLVLPVMSSVNSASVVYVHGHSLARIDGGMLALCSQAAKRFPVVLTEAALSRSSNPQR